METREGYRLQNAGCPVSCPGYEAEGFDKLRNRIKAGGLSLKEIRYIKYLEENVRKFEAK